MSDSRAAAGLDRLPWLTDEPSPKAPRANRGGRDITPWAVAAMLAVAGASFWLGTRNETSERPQSAQPSATVPLPQPRSGQQVHIARQLDVSPAPAPEVRPYPSRQVRAAPSRAIRLTRSEMLEARRAAAERRLEAKLSQSAPQEARRKPAASVQPQQAAPVRVARPVPLRIWPSRVVAGASGRLVQIGAFGSVLQAKRGWWHMVRAYPAVAHLSAVVRPARNSNGRIFYRFQIGTTSQAHSEVLCQRVERIRFSCAVVGLPWKAKVER
jgi:hypothetical protein